MNDWTCGGTAADVEPAPWPCATARDAKSRFASILSSAAERWCFWSTIDWAWTAPATNVSDSAKQAPASRADMPIENLPSGEGKSYAKESSLSPRLDLHQAREAGRSAGDVDADHIGRE